MNSFDAELARLRGEIARSEQLKKRLQSLYPRRDSLASQEAELREIRLEEDEDVQALEGRSLARYFYSLMGSLDERLDREREEAHAAAVDNAGLLQNGQKFGRMRQRLVAHGNERRKEIYEIFILARKFGGGLAHQPYDGEDGALFGLGYGAVGYLCARL